MTEQRYVPVKFDEKWWPKPYQFARAILYAILAIAWVTSTRLAFLEGIINNFYYRATIIGAAGVFIFLICSLNFLVQHIDRNRNGFYIWWFQTPDGTWHFSDLGYPKNPKGLVVQFHVCAKPTFQFFFGSSAWQLVKPTDAEKLHGFLHVLEQSIGGVARFGLRKIDQEELPAGLTSDVVRIMNNSHRWRLTLVRADGVGRVILADSHGHEISLFEDEGNVMTEALVHECVIDYRKAASSRASGKIDTLTNERNVLSGYLEDLRSEVAGTASFILQCSPDDIRGKLEDALNQVGQKWGKQTSKVVEVTIHLLDLIKQIKPWSEQASRGVTRVRMGYTVWVLMLTLNYLLEPDDPRRERFNLTPDGIEKMRVWIEANPLPVDQPAAAPPTPSAS